MHSVNHLFSALENGKILAQKSTGWLFRHFFVTAAAVFIQIVAAWPKLFGVLIFLIRLSIAYILINLNILLQKSQKKKKRHVPHVIQEVPLTLPSMPLHPNHPSHASY